jgi:methionine-S-sulfoxide reductase
MDREPSRTDAEMRERTAIVSCPSRPAARGLSVSALPTALLLLALAGCGPAAPPGSTARTTSAGATPTTAPTATPTPTKGKTVKTIYLAGGCFWGLEKYVDQIHGVTATEVGYANGASASAKYGDGSGYAEAVRVDYDPTVAPLPFLLRTFYRAIDPTSVDRQGNDVGVEYRSGIYYTEPADRPIIEASLAKLQTQHSARIAIETGPLKNYTRAEDYHQDYLQKNPTGYCHIPLSSFKDAAAARPEPSDFAPAE